MFHTPLCAFSREPSRGNIRAVSSINILSYETLGTEISGHLIYVFVWEASGLDGFTYRRFHIYKFFVDLNFGGKVTNCSLSLNIVCQGLKQVNIDAYLNEQ